MTDTTPARMTSERLAEIASYAKEGAYHSSPTILELLSELAAVTRERDIATKDASMLRREVSRESHLRLALRRILDEREAYLAEERIADYAARAANEASTPKESPL